MPPSPAAADASSHRSELLTGVAMALAAATLWGTTGTAQSLAPAGTSPYWVGALRLAVSALFFWLLACWPVRTPTPGPPPSASGRGSGAGATSAILLAGACMAGYNLAFFAGVKATGIAVGTAVAIGSGPVWAGLLQWALARDPPAPLWWLGTALAVVGGVLLVGSGGQGLQADGFGLALCLGAGLGYAAYTLICQRLVRGASPTVVTRQIFSVAALMALPVAALAGGQGVHGASGWAVVAYLGLVTTGLAYLLFSHALRRIAGATGVTLAMAEPVTAFVLAIFVVGERPAALAYAGLAAVLGGLLLVVWTETRGARR